MDAADNPDPQTWTENKPRVAILGGGLAGLSTAIALLAHSIPVTIFEARNRLGGRVAQSSSLGHPVDLGPNWIHGGGSGNPILSFARETGTEVRELEEGEAVFDSEGVRLSDREARELRELLWDSLIPEALEYCQGGNDIVPSRMSLDDFLWEAASWAVAPDASGKRQRELLMQMATAWGAYVGMDVGRQSLRFFWLEKTVMEGDNAFVAGTYAKILEKIIERVKGADVRLGTRVERVDSSGKEEAGENGGLVVEVLGGGRDVFDEVICTVPLGYLKRNAREMFVPPLPERTLAAIASLGYGNLDKVYITFPAAFWEGEGNMDSNTSSSNEQPTDIGTSGTGTDERKAYPPFTHWLPPSYAPAINPDCWDQQAMNLAALPAPNAHPTLLFYIYGDCATHIASLVSSKTGHDTLQSQLADFLQPYYSRLPNYSDTNPACHPKAALATAWTNDELAGYGSYSNFPVGLEAGDKDIETLRRGCPEWGVWFAGEHTAGFESMGTTTGAWESGERVASRILEAHGLS